MLIKNKVRRRNDAKIEDQVQRISGQDFRPSDPSRFSKLSDTINIQKDFEGKHQDLMEELNKLKTEIQTMATQSDEEPERTHNKHQTISKKEVLAALIDEDSENEESINKLQTLLDDSVKLNQRILFSDANNQIWEIIKQTDLNLEEMPAYIE